MSTEAPSSRDLPFLAASAEWTDPRVAARAADEALAVIKAKPRARPPRVKVMMLLDHYVGEQIPPTVLEALSIPLEVREYAVTQARQAAIQRGREAGRPVKEIAAEHGVDPRSTRYRKPAMTRPKNADLYDALVSGPVMQEMRLAVAKALGLLDHQGEWRSRVLIEADRVIRERELFSYAAKVEGMARANKAHALVIRVQAAEIDELDNIFETMRQEVIANGGDVSQLDEALNFQEQADAKAEHWKHMNPRARPPLEPELVTKAEGLARLIIEEARLKLWRKQDLTADEIGAKIGVDPVLVAQWMLRKPDWDHTVAPYVTWENMALRKLAERTLRTK